MRRIFDDLGIESDDPSDRSSDQQDRTASSTPVPDSEPDRYAHVAAGLGSDVPFFLNAPSAEVWGRGEFLRTAPAPRCGGVLLILPPFGVSTPAVFRRLDALRPTAPLDLVDPLPINDWAKLDAMSLGRMLRNDLERAAFDLVPELGRLRHRVEATLGRAVRMSGSGSSLFALFDSEEEAESAAMQMEDALPVMDDGRAVGYLGLPLGRDVPSCVGFESMGE
jgi:4-diphosphocytidyl-2-C-methyl-D-erythritol kinase